jgi:hypothetical protein
MIEDLENQVRTFTSEFTILDISIYLKIWLFICMYRII